MIISYNQLSTKKALFFFFFCLSLSNSSILPLLFQTTTFFFGSLSCLSSMASFTLKESYFSFLPQFPTTPPQRIKSYPHSLSVSCRLQQLLFSFLIKIPRYNFFYPFNIALTIKVLTALCHYQGS